MGADVSQSLAAIGGGHGDVAGINVPLIKSLAEGHRPVGILDFGYRLAIGHRIERGAGLICIGYIPVIFLVLELFSRGGILYNELAIVILEPNLNRGYCVSVKPARIAPTDVEIAVIKCIVGRGEAEVLHREVFGAVCKRSYCRARRYYQHRK